MAVQRSLRARPSPVVLSFAACAAALLGAACDPVDEAALAADDVAVIEDALTALPAAVDEAALDRSASPCDDFYQFACGGFVAANVPTSPQSMNARAFAAAEAVNDEVLVGLVTGAIDAPTGPADERVKAYFDACLAFDDGTYAPGKLTSALAPELAELRAAHAAGGLGALLGTAARHTWVEGIKAFQPLFALSIFPDYLSDGRVALSVEPQDPALLESDPASVQSFLAFFYPSIDQSELARRRELILRVDGELARALTEVPDEQGYHPLGREGLRVVLPHVDFSAYFAALGAKRPSAVVLQSLARLQRIDGVLATLSADEASSYIEYKVLVRWLYSSQPAGSPEAAVRACLGRTLAAFPRVFQPRFASTVVGKKNARLAVAMARQVKAALERQLDEAPFLDLATRVEAKVKLRAMAIAPFAAKASDYAHVQVAPDAFLRNELALGMDRAREALASVGARQRPEVLLLANYTQTNAFYDIVNNRFTILPGIAHGAFFGGRAATPAYNFGALGTIMGHEMTHGFDDVGRRFDARGIARNWWTPAVATQYGERAACFMEQYGAFDHGLAAEPNEPAPARIDGALTLGENIADNGGLRAAFAAALPTFAKSKPVAGFTPAQQFFLAFGQAFCESHGAAAAGELLAQDTHAPAKARINVTLSNFDAFAEAFSCRLGDTMVAANACRVW